MEDDPVNEFGVTIRQNCNIQKVEDMALGRRRGPSAYALYMSLFLTAIDNLEDATKRVMSSDPSLTELFKRPSLALTLSVNRDEVDENRKVEGVTITHFIDKRKRKLESSEKAATKRLTSASKVIKD